MTHNKFITHLITHTFKILHQPKLFFRVMQRQKPVGKNVRNFRLAYTNLQTGLICIDILTPRKRQPKKPSAILRVLAHEIAHHQKPPFRQRFKGRIINRQHYPSFYNQVNKNIAKIKKDPLLGQYFE